MKNQAFSIDIEDRAQLLIAFPRILIMAGEVTFKAGDRLIFEPFGLNVVTFSLVSTLVRCGCQLSMTALKDQSRLMRSPSNFTQMVDDLEARNLVRRIPSREDRRVSLVEATDEGREVIGKVMARYAEVMDDYLKDFPTNEIRDAVVTVVKWIWRISDAAGFDNLKPVQEPFQNKK